MSVVGLLLWVVGLALILGGIAIAGSSPIGLLVAGVGLGLILYSSRTDYDSSRTPSEMMRD